MQAKEHLYFTAERDRLVGEGDPAAAFLYAAQGDEIPDSAAERFGLDDGRLKRRKGGEDKKRKPEGDKAEPKPGLTITKRAR
jgi:hypothetical protein